jgi:hypothetical protein
MDLIKSDNLTFLLCSERSGSNFITKLMNNHSKICGPSTKHLINPVAKNYFRYQPLKQPQQWESLIDDILNLYNVEFSIWKSKFTKQELLDFIIYGDLHGLLTYFFSKETQLNNKEFCFIKEIKTHQFYPFLKSFFKYSKFLYLYRDPRDMALSWKKSHIHKGGVVQAANQWKVDQQEFLKIVEFERLTNSVKSIKYEDLVTKPEKALISALEMTGLNFETKMLDMNKDELTAQNAKTLRAWENLTKPVIKDNFNKFEQELTETEIKYIESICYFEMKYLGYETKFDWDNLKEIRTEEVESYHDQEVCQLTHEPVKGVKENMEAKKRFYQYLN